MQTENAKLKEGIREDYSKLREDMSGLREEFKRGNLELKNELKEEIRVEYEKLAKKCANENERLAKKI
jgi:hypothetical protein